MATYVYETIPQKSGETPLRFEFQQSMKDAPLTCHPETGQALKRVISGGYGIMSSGVRKSPTTQSAPTPCAAGCACHAGPRLPQP